jgi:hypothetical protein
MTTVDRETTLFPSPQPDDQLTAALRAGGQQFGLLDPGCGAPRLN